MFPSTSKDQTVNNLKDSANNLKDSAYEMNNDLHAAANQAGRKVRNIVNTATDEISYASDKVTGEIRNNPLRSSAIALGVGVLLGALLRR